MATMTALEFGKGQAVNVYTEGEWFKGVVADVHEKDNRPYLVRFNAHGVGDEAWFSPASIQRR